MATRSELDAYFSGSPSYELYKKLYGDGQSSYAGDINALYDKQIAQSNAYYDRQLEKLAGQNAQQQQALAANNMRADRNINYQTTQGGLNNSGVQAQARVLNTIAGQRAQGELAAAYAQNAADIEADRAQKAYGIELNRDQALLNEQQNALNRQLAYADVMSNYETQMMNEQAAAAAAAQKANAAATAALSADNLITSSAADMQAYYDRVSDYTSPEAQNIITTYGAEAYTTYLNDVQKKVSALQTQAYKAEADKLINIAEKDAAKYYEQITDEATAAALISSMGRENYNKLLNSAESAAKPSLRLQTINELTGAFLGNAETRELIKDYYNAEWAAEGRAITTLTDDILVQIIKDMISLGDPYFRWISTSDVELARRQAERGAGSVNADVLAENIFRP